MLRLVLPKKYRSYLRPGHVTLEENEASVTAAVWQAAWERYMLAYWTDPERGFVRLISKAFDGKASVKITEAFCKQRQYAAALSEKS